MYNNRIGVIFSLDELLKHGPQKLFNLEINCVQLQSFDPTILTKENAEKVLEMLGNRIPISSFWAGWTGPKVWDSIDGPITLGLVPTAYREQRLTELKKGADFTSWLGVKNLATHCGFIPEQPCYPEYRQVLAAIKHIAQYCKDRDIFFNFETGQETPVTLMRTIKDTGLDNVGINIDPANLILYGRGNPVDALDIFKGYIRGVHVKDGNYPTDFYALGKERVVGEGSVNFPVFLPKLLNQGYTGDLYIEREISGDQQIRDIKETMIYIKNLLKEA